MKVEIYNEDGDRKTVEVLSPQAYRSTPKLCCPVCRSGNVEGGFIEVCGSQAEQTISCNNCEARWIDVYILANYDCLEVKKI